MTNAGRARSHYEDGRVVELEHQLGETAQLHFAQGEHMVHDLQNIGETVLGFVTMEFLESENAPIPLPQSVQVGRNAA